MVSCQVIVLRNGTAMLQRTGPVLAQQRSLVRQLTWITVRKAHTMAGSKQEGWGCVTPQQAGETPARRFVSEYGLQRPGALLLGHLLGQWRDQLISAQLRRLVAAIAHDEEHRSAGQRELTRLGHHHTARVLGILLYSVEMNAAHGVLHIELILKAIGDGLGVADEEQIIGHLLWVGWPRACAVARQERLLRLPWTVRLDPGVLFVVVLVVLCRLLPPMLQ